MTYPGSTNASKARQSVPTSSYSTVVAVIDSAFDIAHPDLQENLRKNAGEIAGNGKDDDNNGYIDDVYGRNFESNNGNVTDSNQNDMGHGTHVAGIVGAVTNNSQGVASLSNNEVKIMTLKL